ncbi:MAG TPA: HEAT repeat domain-containing protein, partial [Chloroflexia bacterium]|nr:HEAT repeat domain-containing protein [Chloroflexia bacterium]
MGTSGAEEVRQILKITVPKILTAGWGLALVGTTPLRLIMKETQMRNRWINLWMGSAIWGLLLLSLAFLPALWMLVVLYSVLLVGVMLRRSAADLQSFPLNVFASVMVFIVVMWALGLNPDSQVRGFTVQWYWVGPLLFLLALVVDFICAHLLNTDWGRRRQGWPTVGGLMQLAQDPTNPDRATAVMNLGEYKDQRALAVLIAAVGDSDPGVQEAARLALLARYRGLRRKQQLYTMGPISETGRLTQPGQVLTPMEKRVEHLLECLCGPPNTAEHKYAVQRLQELGIAAVPSLIQQVEREVTA